MADPEQKNEAQAPVKRAGIERPAKAQPTDQDNVKDGEGEAEDSGERVSHMARSLSGNFTQRQRAPTLRNDEADTAIATAAPSVEEIPRGRGNNGGLATSPWATPPIPAVIARDESTHGRALNVEAVVAELATASVVRPRVTIPPSHAATTSLVQTLAQTLAPPEQNSEQGPSFDGGVFFQVSSEAEYGFFLDRIRPKKLRSRLRRDRRHIAQEEPQTFGSLADELDSIRRRSFFMFCMKNTIRALREHRLEDEMVVILEEATSAKIAQYIKRCTRLAEDASPGQKLVDSATPAAATLTTAQPPPSTPVSQPLEKEVTHFDAGKLKAAIPLPPRTISMHLERVRQKLENEEKHITLAMELKSLVTVTRSSCGPLATVVVVPIAGSLVEAAATEPCSCSDILDGAIAAFYAELMRIEREGREAKAPSGNEANVSEGQQTPAEEDPPEPSATSQIIAAEEEILLRGGAPHYSYSQGIYELGSDDWDRTPHSKTGLLWRTKREATSQFEASQAPSPPPMRRVYTYPSSDVERVSQTPAQAQISARWRKEAVAQPDISLVRSLLTEGQPLNLNFIPLSVRGDPDIQREAASQKVMSRQYGSVVEDSLIQGPLGDFAPTRRYTIPGILRVLKAKTQKYQYRNELLRRQGQLEYTVPLAMDTTQKPGIVTTCVESTAEQVAVPGLSETAPRLKQARPQLDGHVTTEDKNPAKGEISEHLGLRGGALESRPSGQRIACVLEVSSKDYEYDSRYPLLGSNQHPANYLVRSQKPNHKTDRTAIAAGSVFEFAYVAASAEAVAENFCASHKDQKAPVSDLIVGQVGESATVEKPCVKVEVPEGQKIANGAGNAEVLKRYKAIVDDAGIVFERMELEQETSSDVTFEPPTCLNGDDGLREDGLEAGRPIGRLPKYEIIHSKRPMDTPISHLHHGKSYSRALSQRDIKLKARGIHQSQYPGHLSAQLSSARPKIQPTPRIWAGSGAPSVADYSGRHQSVASGPSISSPSCCNWHTEGWMVDGLPGMKNGKSSPSPSLADWPGIVTTLPVMVYMVSSHNIPHNITLKPHNITPELHNLSLTDSFLLFPKHGQSNPSELEQLHLWERLMAAELEDFDRQARESPPMASDHASLHQNLAGIGYAKIVGHGGKGRYELPKEEPSSPSATSTPQWFSSSEASTSTRTNSVKDGAGVSKRRRLDDFVVDNMDEWNSEWCSSDHSPHVRESPKGTRKNRRSTDSDEDWTPMRGGALNADGHGHPHPDDYSNPEDEDSSHGNDAERSVTPIAYMTGRRFAWRRPNAALARPRQNIVSPASGVGLLSLTREDTEQESAYSAMSATARWVGSTEMSFGEHTASVPARAAPGARASLAGSRLPIAGIYSSSSRALNPMRPTTELEVVEDTRSEVADGMIWELRGFPQTPSGILDSLLPDHPLVAFTPNARREANAANVDEEEEAVYQRARSAASVAQVAALWLRYNSQSETPPWEEMREALGLPQTATQEDGLDTLYRESEVLRHLFARFQRYREENASDHPLAVLFTEDTGLRTNDLDIEEGDIHGLAPGDFNIGFEIPPFSPLEHPRIPPGATPSEISADLWEAGQREEAQESEMLVAYGPGLEAIIQHGRTSTLTEMCEALGLSRIATMADVRHEMGTRIAEAGSRLMEGRLHQRRQAENDRQAARAEARREERRERHAEIRAGASRWARPPLSDLSATDSRSPSTISLERVLAEEYAGEQAGAAEAAQEAAGPPSPTESIDSEEPITFAAGGRRVGDTMAARYGHVEVLSDGWDNPLNPSSPTARSNDGLFQGNPLRSRTPNPGLGQQVLEIMRRNNPAQFRQLELLRITQPPRDHPATRAMTFGEHLVSGVPRNRQPSTPVMSGALLPRGSSGVSVYGDVTLGRDMPHPEQMPMWMRSFEHTFPSARIGGIACDRQTYIQSLIHCTIASGQGAGERGGVPEGVWYVCTFRRRLTERPKRMSDVPLLRFGRISIDHDHVNRPRDTYNSDVESDEDEEFTFCEWEALFPACAVKDMLRSTDASWGVKAMRARNWALEEMDTDPKSDGCCEALGEWWERVRGVNGAAGDCRVRKVDVRVLEP